VQVLARGVLIDVGFNAAEAAAKDGAVVSPRVV
jgi:hypothetical protein